MKVFHVRSLYFKLPDDFEGDISEALRALADYHDQVDGTPKQVDEPGDQENTYSSMTVEGFEECIWAEFWDMIHTSDRRHRGQLSVFDPDNWQAEEAGGPDNDRVRSSIPSIT